MRNAYLILAALAVSFGTAEAQQPLAFEVASVHLHQGRVQRKGPFAVTGPLIRMQGYTLFGLILDAYDLRDFQLLPGPRIKGEEIADILYDVAARAPGTATPRLDDVRAMLRTLLETRFGLKVHREMRTMPVLTLVARGNQTHLERGEPGQPCTIRTRLAPDGRNNEEILSACPVEMLAHSLTRLAGDRPVLDRTGLAGIYNFRLTAIPSWRVGGEPQPTDIDPSTAVSLLGLRLVPQKAPIEVLVVDQIEKPGEN